jgi:hypothetical protein
MGEDRRGFIAQQSPTREGWPGVTQEQDDIAWMGFLQDDDEILFSRRDAFGAKSKEQLLEQEAPQSGKRMHRTNSHNELARAVEGGLPRPGSYEKLAYARMNL